MDREITALVIDMSTGQAQNVSDLKALTEQELLDAWAGLQWLEKQINREFGRRKRANDRAAKKTASATAR